MAIAAAGEYKNMEAQAITFANGEKQAIIKINAGEEFIVIGQSRGQKEIFVFFDDETCFDLRKMACALFGLAGELQRAAIDEITRDMAGGGDASRLAAPVKFVDTCDERGCPPCQYPSVCPDLPQEVR